MKAWLSHHAQAINLVIAQFKGNVLSRLFIALTIAISLALPIIMYLVLSSISGLVGAVKNDSQINLFLKADATPTMVDSIHNTLATHAGIKAFQFVSKADALKALNDDVSNQDIIGTLAENPLPDAFFIEPNSLEPDAIAALKQDLTQLDGIEDIQVDDAWLKRLGYLLAFGEKALIVLSLLLGFALFAIIGNTVRMQILTQQEEIEVSQLIGATHNFIRRPFLYAGAFYGLAGALIALIISAIVMWLFNLSIAALAAEYQSDFSLLLPDTSILLVTCCTAMVIGLVSAYIAVSKSLFKLNN